MTTIEGVANQVVELLKDRNAKYGDENLMDFGVLGLVIRINDKLGRIKTALSNRDPGTDAYAIIEDALKDIAGYAINGLRLMEEGKLPPLGKAMENYILVNISSFKIDKDVVIIDAE